jgi:hypothetical protein
MGIGLTLIVIFVVVWIVTNVIRAQQDAAQAARRPINRAGGAAAGRAPDKTSSSDIDRFLQEIDRLRKKNQDQTASESRPKPQPPRPQKQPDAPRVREAPPRRAQSERKKATSERKAPRPLPPAPTVTVPAPVSVITPAPKPPRVSQIERSHPEVQPVKPIVEQKPSDSRGPEQKLNGPFETLKVLFKSGEGLAAAVLLHEILAAPKCRRRPGPS